MGQELPIGWIEVDQGDLGDYINGFAFKPAHWGKVGRPIIRIQNLTNSKADFNYSILEVDEGYHVQKGDILVSWSATLDAFIWNGPDAILNQHIFKVVPSPHLDKAFVYYLLKNSIAELVKSEHLHGTTMKHINRKPFLTHKVLLPPLDEQKRISDKIEELFSRLDEGEAALRRVQRLLTSYRQAVLKAAVMGELTKEWREANQHRLESGADLLQRILKARREQWQGRGQYQEPQPPDASNLPKLPVGWVWAIVEILASNDAHSIADGPFGSNLKTAHYRDEGVRVIRLENIGDGVFVNHEKYISKEHAATLHRHSIHAGDLVIASLGSPLPKACQVPAYIETAIVKADCIKYKPNADFIESRFVLSWLVSPLLRDMVVNMVRGVGRPRMNLRDIKLFPVPLPNLIEQQEIVERLDDIFSRIDALEAWCNTELTRSATLRQSILKAAFSGQLVPQDPNDEPASVLLQRIQSARQTPAAKPTARPLSKDLGKRTPKQPTLWEPT